MITPEVAWIIGISFMLIYEAWALWQLKNGKRGWTLSESVWRNSKKYPLLPFLVGLLCGHFFWGGY